MQGIGGAAARSDRVASQNPGLLSPPVTLKVSVLPRTTIFVLRATGENPEYTKAFLQACMEEYHQPEKGDGGADLVHDDCGADRPDVAAGTGIAEVDDQMQSFLGTNDAALLQEASGVGNYLCRALPANGRAPVGIRPAPVHDAGSESPAGAGSDAGAVGADGAGPMAGTAGGGCWSMPALAEQSGMLAPTPSAWSI